MGSHGAPQTQRCMGAVTRERTGLRCDPCAAVHRNSCSPVRSWWVAFDIGKGVSTLQSSKQSKTISFGQTRVLGSGHQPFSSGLNNTCRPSRECSGGPRTRLASTWNSRRQQALTRPSADSKPECVVRRLLVRKVKFAILPRPHKVCYQDPPSSRLVSRLHFM